MAAIQAVRKLAEGAAPRSDTERHIKANLHRKTVCIFGVRGHIGIEGNEKGDHQAEFQSFLEEICGSLRLVMDCILVYFKELITSVDTLRGHMRRYPDFPGGFKGAPS